MKTSEAKKIAVAVGYEFYWDPLLQMWTLLHEDRNVEGLEDATYHTKNTLYYMTPERFKEAFVRGEMPEAEVDSLARLAIRLMLDVHDVSFGPTDACRTLPGFADLPEADRERIVLRTRRLCESN